MLSNDLAHASASPTPGSTHSPATSGGASQTTIILQITIAFVVGAATITLGILGFRLAKGKEKREALRDQKISLANDPIAAIRINKESEAYCIYINEHLMQLFGDLSSISDLRHPYIDDHHPLLLKSSMFPTAAQNQRYRELIGELDRHGKALGSKVESLRSLLPSLARIPSPSLSPTLLAQALEQTNYLVSRLRKLDSLFPDEARRLLQNATDHFGNGFSSRDNDNEPA